MTWPGDPEELHRGAAGERTELAWTRTAIAFAAVGGAMLRTSLTGLIVLAMSILIWGLAGHLLPGAADAAGGQARPAPLLLVALTVTAVSVVALLVALW